MYSIYIFLTSQFTFIKNKFYDCTKKKFYDVHVLLSHTESI